MITRTDRVFCDCGTTLQYNIATRRPAYTTGNEPVCKRCHDLNKFRNCHAACDQANNQHIYTPTPSPFLIGYRIACGSHTRAKFGFTF